ncbi:hypothetical protein BS50DRAFT_171878 [Corynespora cassiicola Philippines]|uniref:Uncharacterized protein n=1 Tax=Corynespora cassiicola Philippines TaxID=1448308 RepID=A0A2T2P5A1_CORCC|nr:hypothetical protein BS50DRAFT_171878 [Corynespora cassiicola Philippines]
MHAQVRVYLHVHGNGSAAQRSSSSDRQRHSLSLHSSSSSYFLFLPFRASFSLSSGRLRLSCPFVGFMIPYPISICGNTPFRPQYSHTHIERIRIHTPQKIKIGLHCTITVSLICMGCTDTAFALIRVRFNSLHSMRCPTLSPPIIFPTAKHYKKPTKHRMIIVKMLQRHHIPSPNPCGRGK